MTFDPQAEEAAGLETINEQNEGEEEREEAVNDDSGVLVPAMEDDHHLSMSFKEYFRLEADPEHEEGGETV
jgi:hypothetical protein